jgi:polyisoprenoid-binding protein YceI
VVSTVPHVLTGAVTTADGWPLPGATVTVVGAAGRQLGRSAADPGGRFAVELSGSGPATVVVAAAGLEPLARTLTIAADHDRDLGTLVLRSTGQGHLPAPGTWTIDPVHTIVRATARHLGMSRVEGRFTELSGTIVVTDPIEASHVTVAIEAASIDTGNHDRDTHLRSPDFLDVKRFPTLTYRGRGLTRRSDEDWLLAGALTIRDVTHEVALDMHYGGTGPDPWGGTRMALTATTQLSRADYAITWNMGLPGGLTVVGPTLRIDLDIQAVLS